MGKDPARDGTTMTANGPGCGHPKLGAIALSPFIKPGTVSAVPYTTTPC